MSSFDSPKSEDLSKLLEILDPPRRIQSNPLYMVSIGIQKLYKNIDKSIEPSTPLLDRYQLETLLG